MMKISDLLSLCFSNLFRRKGRTALTVIGVVIGTCSIIVMVSLGVASNKAQEEMLSQWGDLTQIQIINYGSGNAELPALDDTMIKEIRKIENVVTATPYYSSYEMMTSITAGKNNKYQLDWVNLIGVYPDSLDVLGFQLSEGNYFEEGLSGKKIPVVVGQYTAYNFEDTTKSYRSNKRRVDRYTTDAEGNIPDPFFDILKEKLSFNLLPQDEKAKEIKYELQVEGILQEDYGKGWFTSEGVIMDINLLKKLEAEYRKENNIKSAEKTSGYEEVVVKVNDVKNIEEVENIIKDIGYETYSMSSQREEMQKQSMTLQMILGGIGAISLLVAAIGIANTMVMSIYERTKEIGVMKVLGCKLSNIRIMFLIESATIGLIGGVVGIALSYLLSFIFNTFAGSMGQYLGNYASGPISVIPIWLVALGMGFSCFVGLVSGIVPANKAVKISALEAIRRE